MPVVLVSVLLILVSALALSTANLLRDSKEARLGALRSAQAFIFDELKRYHAETGSFPASLAAMSTQPGFEHLKSYVPRTNGGGNLPGAATIHLVVSNLITVGSYSAQRAAVIVLYDTNQTITTYLSAAKNTCAPASGAADFANAVSWCGSSTGAVWSAMSGFQLRNDGEAMAYRKMKATADKLVRRYGTTGNFPGTSGVLRTLVTATTGSSVGTSAATCAGTFSLNGVGLECGDLYNPFGNPLSYRLVTAKQIELSGTAGINISAGGPPGKLFYTATMP